MKRRLLLFTALCVGAVLPQQANAQFWTSSVCGGASLNACIDFSMSLYDTNPAGKNLYEFTVRYVSATLDGVTMADGDAAAGVVRAVGLYDLSNYFTFGTPEKVAGYGEWTGTSGSGCGTAGDAVGNDLFEACADADAPPPANGLLLGQWVTFRFDAAPELNASDFLAPLAGFDGTGTGDAIGARVHIIAWGDDCSVKVDHHTGAFSDGCGVPVPEPTSLLLLGSGLVGVGILARRRRSLLDVDNG